MGSVLFDRAPVVVRGGGDLASGVIYRLVKAGFPVYVTELARPLAIRRAVAFASAVFDGAVTIEGLTARLAQNTAEAQGILAAGAIPVMVDEEGTSLDWLAPLVVIDARMAKRNLGTRRDDAPLVVALGPGFEAGKDCHAVIETNRGHTLGRVIWQGTAEADSGKPGSINGHSSDRVLRAPAAGLVEPYAAIGDMLRAGQLVGVVGEAPIVAPFEGVLRGLIHPSVPVVPGMKIGDVDPRAVREHCFTISEKALAVGGGVLEAILGAPALRSAVR